jgi:hypothetical protein
MEKPGWDVVSDVDRVRHCRFWLIAGSTDFVTRMRLAGNGLIEPRTVLMTARQ